MATPGLARTGTEAPDPNTGAAAVAPGRTAARRRWSWPLATTLSALILYVPHLVPLVGEHLSRATSCRQSWLEHLPVLPGLWTSSWLLAFVDVQTGSARRMLAGVLSVLAFAALAWLLTRGPWVRWISAAVATAYFGMHAGFMLVLFAM